jgi:hypothetical protein
LLSIEIDGADASTLVVNAPEMPISSSPSSTYPLRVAIIQVIAPIAVFMNDFIGNALGVIIKSLVAALYFGLIILLCGFTALTVVSSLWRCFRGPSFVDTAGRVQGGLERLKSNERLRTMKIDGLCEKMESLCRNERFITFIKICENGWHPERNEAEVSEEQTDVEKGSGVKEEG